MPRITLLVGENSTGKTTFMRCYKTLANIACPEPDRHQEDAFDLIKSEKFHSIAHDGEATFMLGGKIKDDKNTTELRYNFSQNIALPCEHSMELECQAKQKHSLAVKRKPGRRETWLIRGKKFCHELEAELVSWRAFSDWLSRSVRHGQLPYNGDLNSYAQGDTLSTDARIQLGLLFTTLGKISELLPRHPPGIMQVSPEIELPSGIIDANQCIGLQNAMASIIDAGIQMELFDDMEITCISENVYELSVYLCGKKRNIKDVGLGVHTVIQILKSMAAQDNSMTYLLQQPETHLHPQAEALLAKLIAQSNSRYIIETHADGIIDRLRICVMDGTINPDDLLILYFESKRGSSRIHEIHTDKHGNLEGQPSSYRSFFTKETNQLLGLS